MAYMYSIIYNVYVICIHTHRWFVLISITLDFMSVLCAVHTVSSSFADSALNTVST